MPDVSAAGTDETPHVLAFYLPQFHLVPENDAWHGHGFTEWTVVAKSKPLFPGHRQPDLPGELGFYDLRVPETRYLQARLAREHGITGFLYYHYWFSGRRMLGRPFQEVLASGQPDFPFALCWANESWYRRWQGSTDEMILEQVFSEEDDLAHIRWLIEAFKDPRYIRVHGRPLLTVYRADVLPNSSQTAELWRRECEEAGIPPPWLVMFETRDGPGDPAALGFDASAEFVPHLLPSLVASPPERLGEDGSHISYDYDEVGSAYLGRPTVPWPRYPCVATGWDNSPRRQTGEALILRNASPDGYGRWLREATRRQAASDGGNGIVFLNAWNEWAEGAHLEPDLTNGRAYLEATRGVIEQLFGPVPESPAAPSSDLHPTAVEDLYQDLYEQFVALQISTSGFLSYYDRRIREWRKYYEEMAAQAREDVVAIATLNQTMAEQLQAQADQLRAFGMHEPTPQWWLARK
jgi:O-antigen biosynthesis protein